MEQLSEDDRNLAGMTQAELDLAWDLWFDLAQSTNPFDPPYTHGVFQEVAWTIAHQDRAAGSNVSPGSSREDAPASG